MTKNCGGLSKLQQQGIRFDLATLRSQGMSFEPPWTPHMDGEMSIIVGNDYGPDSRRISTNARNPCWSLGKR
jgi:hypothetical protein